MQYTKWICLIIGALCIIMVAGYVGASHLYYMAAILLTLPCVSYFLGWLALQRLGFERSTSGTAWEGEQTNLNYVVSNATQLPRYFLTIREILPDWVIPLRSETALFNVGALDKTQVSLRVQFDKRGVVALEGFDVTAMDPLGVFAFTRRVLLPGELVVYPKVDALAVDDIMGAEHYGTQEFTSQLLHGSSIDPDGVRRYVVGDPLRRIHWRQTARTGQLSVIEFEEAQSRDLVIALDLKQGAYGMSGTHSPLEYAVRFAASTVTEAIRQGADVRLLTPISAGESEADTLAFGAASQAGRGPDQESVLLTALARVEARAKEPISTLLGEAAPILTRGTTLLVLTSGTDSELPEVLRRCAAMGTNVAVAIIDVASFSSARALRMGTMLEQQALEMAAWGARVGRLSANPEHALLLDGFARPGLAGTEAQAVDGASALAQANR